MRRPRKTRDSSWSSADTMAAIPQSPTKLRPRSRDTGFPEPFCGQGNTTLPHPDADVSGSASISADDIPISRVLSRQRRSFLSGKNSWKRTVSHGVITPEMHQMYSDAVLVESDNESPAPTGGVKTSHGLGQSSKEGGYSLERVSSSANGDGDQSPTAREPPQLRTSTESSQRRSFWGRFGSHGHKHSLSQ